MVKKKVEQKNKNMKRTKAAAYLYKYHLLWIAWVYIPYKESQTHIADNNIEYKIRPARVAYITIGFTRKATYERLMKWWNTKGYKECKDAI